MKRILFIINSMNVGGAEKSLVSLLNLLPKEEYEIDLYLLINQGIFLSQIPKHVTIKEVRFPYTCLVASMSDFNFYFKHGIKWWAKRIYRSLTARIENKQRAVIQTLWQKWEKDIPMYEKYYDIAVSFQEGTTNYYVIDKVNAKKKILWIHTIYDQMGFSSFFDKYYFEKADKVVTVSNICKESLQKNFPDIESNKFIVLENLTSQELITTLSKEELDDSLFKDESKNRILSVGRLHPVKAYDLALEAAKVLKDRRFDFVWYIVGGGELREELETMKTSLDLNGYVYFIGEQVNPYKYMRYADVVVQSSKFEGKSIVLDEAKLLGKPIVSTNYSTITDTIVDRETGLITEMTANSLADGIFEMLDNEKLRNKIVQNINGRSKDSIQLLKEYTNILCED